MPGDPNPPELSGDTYTIVKTMDGIFVRNFCRHCLDPACASACPVGALKKTGAGPVVYDGNKCIGCRYCFVACPYGIPRYQWTSANPLVRKCDLCAERLKQGRQTACAQICPTGATKFGEREELLKDAKSRQTVKPQAYFQHIFGEFEAGGSSVLFVASKDLSKLLRIPRSTKAMPELTRPALSSVPPLGTATGAILIGIWWTFKRRQDVARAECSSDKKECDGRKQK